MMDMLSGGGGYSNSSSSSAKNGDFKGGGVGNVTFNNGTSAFKQAPNYQLYAVLALVALLVILLWKK
ncbi:hypothetical protein [Vibrio europaeus]|uniref:hypothetical protein n=1 Tax=Vibrio europaeus TaxID=300876 RepID=UPI002340EF9C|nr:hypothetical protein [Vibrio europaeus]MDC5837755.1 hypothetical protein [Vibrio europaeus]